MKRSKRTIHSYLADIGRRGGRARARALSKEERKKIAVKASLVRWMNERFGVKSFSELGLPGSEIVDKGLILIAEGKYNRIESLAVAEVTPRLRFLNVPVPHQVCGIKNPRRKLYRLMEKKEQGLAYPRFHALLERLDSFCDALSAIHKRKPAQRRDRSWCS